LADRVLSRDTDCPDDLTADATEEKTMSSRPAHGADTGFHEGELTVQRRAGVHLDAARLSGMLQPVALAGGIVKFLAQRTFLAVTARDAAGRLWTSPLVGRRGFLVAQSETALAIHAAIPAGDPLHRISAAQKVGMVTIDFAARRRVRLNGTLVAASRSLLLVEIEQAFGNCPQYIQQRLLAPDEPARADSGTVRRGTTLQADDVCLIEAADTFFLGTVHPQRGADASHRGGPPGFVRVDDSGLWWPDYRGNNMFNSFGNLAVDPEAALLFCDFTTRQTLHLSGTSRIDWGDPDRPGDDGHTGRIARFAVERLVSGRLLPVHETAHRAYRDNPALTD
jgi:predicted pyridoxine 5'-phosphate oxidase superfamily flavin-nucleotide-binding protein